MQRIFPNRIAITFAILCLGLTNAAFGDELLNVTVNTSGLGAGNSEVLFILTGVGGNTTTMANFSLAGGTAGAVDNANTSGSGTGTANGLNSGVQLNTSTDFLNVFAQAFMAGSHLSFLLDLTTNVVSPNPDQFSLVILDPTGNPISTSDPTGFDNLFAINIDSATPAPSVYSNLVTITAPVSAPEPSSIFLLAVSLLASFCIRRTTSSVKLK